MHFQNLRTCFQFRSINEDAPVKTPRTKQCTIQHIRTIGCCHYNNVCALFKAIHLGKDLIESLLALVVTTTESGTATLAPDSINLINKDDARCITFCFGKEITHTAGTNTYEHFYKLRSGNRKERYARFARDSTCQECFTCSRSTNKNHASGDLGANARVLFGVF